MKPQKWRLSLSADSNMRPPFKDRIIPWYFVMGFAIVFAVNGVFVYQAVHTNTGLVTEEAYEKGIAYNDVLAHAKAQHALGWKDKISYENGQLQVTLRDAKDLPLENAKVMAYISRPTQDGMDQTHPLAAQGGGVYAAPISLPALGQWEVGVSVICNQQQFQAHRRIVVQ